MSEDQKTASTRQVGAGGAGAETPRPRDWSRLRGRKLAGRYRLDEEIGQGGFGVVFQGKDTRLEKRVAVKVLSMSLAENPDALARFKQEATSAARIGHKNIVDVTDVGEDEDGTHFLVMEYIEGTDLGSVMREEGPLELDRALTLCARVAQALAAAHARDIVHRDLKPDNVLLTAFGSVSDYPKVLDFGISKVMRLDETRQTLTSDGQVVGTPRYMAPEQGMGNRPIDGRADVYALGSILYEMVTGQPPFSGATHYEIIHNKASHDPLPPSVIKPDLDDTLELDRLILRALQRDPADRYESMADFEEAIRELLEQVDPAAAAAVRPVEPTPRPTPRPRSSVAEPSSDSLATQALGPTPTSASRLSGKVPAGVPPRTMKIRRKRGRLALTGGAIALLCAVGAVAFLRLGGGSEGGGASEAPEPAPESPESRSAAAPPPPEREQERQPEHATEAPKPPDKVKIQWSVEPEDAVVELEGVAVTENPIELPKSNEAYEVVIRAPGYRAERREIRPVANGELEVKLKRKRQEKESSSTKPPRLPDSPL